MTSTNFATLSNFQSDPTAPLLENFRRLAIQEGWKKKSKTYKEQRRVFLAEAVEVGFLSTFGVNVSSLQAWQSLCKTIGVPEAKEGDVLPLTSISACKTVCSQTDAFRHFQCLLMSPWSIGPQGRLRQSRRSRRCWYGRNSHPEEIRLSEGTGQVYS
jgi:hypothetical protein